jgi:phosphoribosylanthranilate isomerase
VQVKICGVTTPEDARAIAEAGAEFIGLNFHRPSRRFVPEARARLIVAALPPTTRAVGVFVDHATNDVARIARGLGLSIVQLHGSEPNAQVRALADSGLETIKAFRIGDEASLNAMARWLCDAENEGALPSWILIDADVAGFLGGSGQTIPQHVLSRVRSREISSGRLREGARILLENRLILAGGLTPENVTELAAQIQPAVVDVASGVESEPARKDLARVQRFIAAARGVPCVDPLRGAQDTV